MKSVFFAGLGDIRVADVPEPRIQEPTDAIVRLTASAICGTDLHMIRGTLSAMKPGRILGDEGVGVLEETGAAVTNFVPGNRVLVLSTVACGYRSYCRAGYYLQCDHANPNGEGTAFFGGRESAGGLDGLQAELARVPFAAVTPVKLPDEVAGEQAILVSDIFPTGYFVADLAEIHPGHTVAVFGCGPVGQFAIASALHLGAGRVIAVDTIPSRLEAARQQGAEIVDFNAADPVERIRELTGGIGADRAIDAVGMDAVAPHSGPRTGKEAPEIEERLEEVRQVAPDAHPQGGNWIPGDAPPRWPNPEPRTGAVQAYRSFDERQPGWVKVELIPRRLNGRFLQ